MKKNRKYFQDKPYRLGLYEKAMPDSLSLPEKLDLARLAGFDFVELSIDESEGKLGRLNHEPYMWLTLLRHMDETGFRFETICLSGHRKYPLGSHDPEIRERSLKMLKQAIRLARVMNIPVIQLAGYDVFYEDGDLDSLKYFMQNLSKGVDFAASHCVNLAFETMETPFMDTTEKALKVCQAIDNPFLQIYPDIGNLQNAAVKYGFDICSDLAKGKGHIVAAHLKETKPGHYRNMFFGDPSGHTPYEAAIKELAAQGVRRFTAEFWYLGSETYERDVRMAAQFLRSKLDKEFKNLS